MNIHGPEIFCYANPPEAPHRPVGPSPSAVASLLFLFIRSGFALVGMIQSSTLSFLECFILHVTQGGCTPLRIPRLFYCVICILVSEYSFLIFVSQALVPRAFLPPSYSRLTRRVLRSSEHSSYISSLRSEHQSLRSFHYNDSEQVPRGSVLLLYITGGEHPPHHPPYCLPSVGIRL